MGMDVSTDENEAEYTHQEQTELAVTIHSQSDDEVDNHEHLVVQLAHGADEEHHHYHQANGGHETPGHEGEMKCMGRLQSYSNAMQSQYMTHYWRASRSLPKMYLDNLVNNMLNAGSKRLPDHRHEAIQGLRQSVNTCDGRSSTRSYWSDLEFDGQVGTMITNLLERNSSKDW